MGRGKAILQVINWIWYFVKVYLRENPANPIQNGQFWESSWGVLYLHLGPGPFHCQSVINQPLTELLERCFENLVAVAYLERKEEKWKIRNISCKNHFNISNTKEKNVQQFPAMTALGNQSFSAKHNSPSKRGPKFHVPSKTLDFAAPPRKSCWRARTPRGTRHAFIIHWSWQIPPPPASSTSRMTKWQTDVTTCCCRRRRVALEWVSRIESFFFLASLFWWPLPSASCHKVILIHRMWWVRVIFYLLQRSGFLGHCELQISWRRSYKVVKLLTFRRKKNTDLRL